MVWSRRRAGGAPLCFSRSCNGAAGLRARYDCPYDAVLCDIDGMLRHWPVPGHADLDRLHGLPAGTLAAAAFTPVPPAPRNHGQDHR